MRTRLGMRLGRWVLDLGHGLRRQISRERISSIGALPPFVYPAFTARPSVLLPDLCHLDASFLASRRALAAFDRLPVYQERHSRRNLGIDLGPILSEFSVPFSICFGGSGLLGELQNGVHLDANLPFILVKLFEGRQLRFVG